MKKAVIAGERRAEVVDVPDPSAKGPWVVVKVHTAPMCAEYKSFVSGTAVEYPGHEAAGEVVEVAQEGRFGVGDRVAVMPLFGCGRCSLCLAGEYIHCQAQLDFAGIHGTREGSGTMAQYLLKPDWLLVAVPEGMSYDHASMACCGLGPSFGAMELMRLEAHETILVTGLGPVGLGAVINATYRGARVIGADPNPKRAQRALDLGAEAVVDSTQADAPDQVLSLAQGQGVDAALDCSGVPAAHRLCIDATRRKGRVAFVGECYGDTPVRVSPDLIRKGLALVGVWHYNMKDTPRMMRMIAEVGPQLDRLITHRFPLTEVQRAWELQAEGECGKVLLEPWAE